jgi:hypothetical protein
MQKAYVSTGGNGGEELGEGTIAWTHIAQPLQIKWDASNSYLNTQATGWGKDQCLQFRDEAKVDGFSCQDDPAGESLWMHTSGKLVSFGDPTKCLATDSTNEPKLQDCDTVPTGDTWQIPTVSGGYGKLRSVAKSLCLHPVDGQGSRKLQFSACTDTTLMKWKVDIASGNPATKGLCTNRWPKDVSGKPTYSNVPLRRSCFATTGSALGVWSDEPVLESDVAAGFHITPGARLTNHRMGLAPLAGIDTPEICSERCKETPGCRTFNYDPGVKSCELVSQTKASAPSLDFLENATLTTSYYEPKMSTVNTRCESNCLPSQVTRLQYPVMGSKFGDSQGLMPTAIADHFDSILFGGSADANQRAECFAKVDAIVIEVESFCQAAKTTLCAPQATDPSNVDKCDVKKEAVCRRMVVMPTTFFGSAKAAYRTNCGHGSSQDGKVWHSAKLSVDSCGAINGFGSLCGDIESLV